ncbi:mucin-2-like [Planococcus citri]|uniref:mucin-2-like n=1 Tax=Planococcus citri TaxID=170843 RepID=UPI0031F8CED3
MKAIITLCFTFTFAQVVVSRVRYGDRTIRQAVETAEEGQLQQPPVALQSLPSANSVAPALNSQPNFPAVLSTSSLENVQPTSSFDQPQLPSNPIVSPNSTPSFDGTSNIPAQIPPPNQPLTSTSPLTPSCSITSNYGTYQLTPRTSQSQILSNPITSAYDVSQSATLTPASQISSNPTTSPNNNPQLTPLIHPSSQVVSPNVITSYNNFPIPSLQYPSQIPSSPISSPNSISQSAPLTYPSQIPSNPTASPYSISQSAPLTYPSQSSNTITSYTNPQATPLTYPSQIPPNPITSPYGIYPGFSNLPQQAPIQGYPYAPVSPYGTPYNPYYSQYSMANTNPQMMYGGMPPYQMPYMPFAPTPSLSSTMNYTSAPVPYSNQTSPQITSPYPAVPPNYIPASSDADQLATPTVVSSTGESGTDLNSLPPQVKEFIDMIPQILSMDESSQPQNTHDFKRPPMRKFPKLPPTRSSLLKKKQYYNSNNYPSASYSGYSQRYGDYY